MPPYSLLFVIIISSSTVIVVVVILLLLLFLLRYHLKAPLQPKCFASIIEFLGPQKIQDGKLCFVTLTSK